MLKIKSLYKIYAGKKIGEFNFELLDNQTVVIIGKSGAGKSTLIKLLTGVVKKDGGEVLLNNQNLTKKDFTYISQIGTLFNHLTIKDNLYLTYQGAEEEIIKVLAEVNLNSSFLNKYPFELSGGERQRIDLVRAIIAKTKMIILDEAFSALDTKTKDDIYEVLKKLRKNHNLLILIITHDLDEALYLGDKLLILAAGQIVFNDKALNILKNDNQYITDLISASRLQRLRKVYLDE
ncbi:MAG: ATP-binding cassette domain-containing protein [Mycoplasmatales bacterium]